MSDHVEDLFDDGPTVHHVTEKQFAQAVRELGGTRRALIGGANPDLLACDSQLRDQWLTLRHAWDELDTLVADMDRHLAELSTRPPAPDRTEFWSDYRALCDAVDQHVGLGAPSLDWRERHQRELERWHRAVIKRHVRDGRPVWRLNLAWERLGESAIQHLGPHIAGISPETPGRFMQPPGQVLN